MVSQRLIDPGLRLVVSMGESDMFRGWVVNSVRGEKGNKQFRL